MTESCFSLSIENNVAHIVLNRPKAFNAMPRAFWNELPVIVNDINDNAKARVIVLSSTGKHFTAGMDISVFTDGEGEIYERQQQFQEQTFQTVALPFYAVIEPDGKTIATFPGLTRNTQEFVDFLKKAL